MRKYEDGRVEKMNLINRGCRYQEKIHQELNYRYGEQLRF